MTLVSTIGFEEGTVGATPAVDATYLLVNGTNQFVADARHGDRALKSVNGGFVALPTPSSNFTVSSYVRMVSAASGSARVQTATDAANGFVGFTRMHTSGLFDICDNTSTRQAASVATWALGVWYRLDTQFGGAGTARTCWTKVFVADSMDPVWDSGVVAITAASASATARCRIGCQGLTTGEVTTDTVRFYDALEWPLPPWAQFGVPL